MKFVNNQTFRNIKFERVEQKLSDVLFEKNKNNDIEKCDNEQELTDVLFEQNKKNDIEKCDSYTPVKENEEPKVLEDDTKVQISKASVDCKKEQSKKKNFSKTFKCDLCAKSYTWYSGLSNHKRFVHSRMKET